MDPLEHTGNDFQERLLSHMQNLGEPIIDPEVEKKLEQIWKSAPFNTFFLMVDVRKPSIIRTHRLLPVLGYSSLDMESFLQLIHPAFQQIQYEFGASAYQLAYRLGKQVRALAQTYSIQYPIKTAEKGYWWVNQLSESVYFDKNDQMVVHLNTYQLFRPYQNEGPSRPLLVFHNQNIKHDFSDAAYTLITPWLQDFTPNEKRLLREYWKLNKQDTKLTNEEMAERLGWTHNQVTNRNKTIKQKAENAFPVSQFRTAQDVGRTLFRLFGDPDKLNF